jgi:hypothetical protein
VVAQAAGRSQISKRCTEALLYREPPYDFSAYGIAQGVEDVCEIQSRARMGAAGGFRHAFIIQ